ncbi:MAG: sortase [Minisyncoccia bacterium]
MQHHGPQKEPLSVRLVGATRQAYQKKWIFLFFFLVIFSFTLVFLVALDIVPNAPKDARVEAILSASPLVAAEAAPRVVVAKSEAPVKIVIPKIGLTASIANPATTDVETLDRYLLKGAVRYPTSALLGEEGNVILFAHSSYLPVVSNLAYKTFDDIQKLKKGDSITVYSSENVYVYKVDEVKNDDANSGAIPLTVSGSKLTLSTCDSFGTKSDRFVVTASLVESHALGA